MPPLTTEGKRLELMTRPLQSIVLPQPLLVRVSPPPLDHRSAGLRGPLLRQWDNIVVTWQPTSSKWNDHDRSLQISWPGPTPHTGDMWLHDCGIAHYRLGKGTLKDRSSTDLGDFHKPLDHYHTRTGSVHEHCTNQATNSPKSKSIFLFFTFPKVFMKHHDNPMSWIKTFR